MKEEKPAVASNPLTKIENTYFAHCILCTIQYQSPSELMMDDYQACNTEDVKMRAPVRRPWPLELIGKMIPNETTYSGPSIQDHPWIVSKYV